VEIDEARDLPVVEKQAYHGVVAERHGAKGLSACKCEIEQALMPAH